MTLTAGVFVRSAIRVPVEIRGSLGRTARREYRSICKVLETKQVYSRFELGPNHDLWCVFSPEQGLLMGETVRDWIWRAVEHAGDSPRNFLWCEKFGEGEFALVYVLNGRVCREAFATPRTAQMEVEALVRRGRVHDPDFRIFLHGLELAEFGLAEEPAISMLDRSVLERIDEITKNLPQVSSFHTAISRISGNARLRRYLLVALALAAALPAAWYAQSWYRLKPEIAPVVVVNDSGEREALVREYNELLAAGDAGDILPALHGAIVRFLTDPVFGAYWVIEEVQWNRGDPRLEIQAVLHKGESPPEDEGEALSAARQAQLRQAAEALGWTLAIDRFNGTFLLPVEWNPRTPEEVGELPRAQPLSSEHRWHPERLHQDMLLIGVLEAEGPDERNSVYLTQPLVLKLTRVPWPTGQTARWLGRRLEGSPLSLDSVSLKSVSNGAGVFMDGTVRFRLVWRIPDSTPHPAY